VREEEVEVIEGVGFENVREAYGVNVHVGILLRKLFERISMGSATSVSISARM
jgi:hypothetical protein